MPALPIAAGTTLPPVSLPATVADLETGTPLVSSVTVSSNDGNPANASDNGTVATPTVALVGDAQRHRDRRTRR